MQKTKNIRLLIALIILLVASVGVYYFMGRSRSNVVDPTLFRLEDYKAIDKVVFTSAADTVVLDYTGSRWRVADSLVVDRNLVDVLFATLAQAIPKRPVAGKLQDSIAAALEHDGIRISLYSENQKKQTLYAGGNKQKTQAYFMAPDEKAPYIMEIPGYRVYVSGILELDANGWRDKYVFGFNWQNFQHLEASFPSAPARNFGISMIDRGVQIDGLHASDTTRLNDFLDAVSLLTVNSFLPQSARDSLQGKLPIMKIVVTDVGKRAYTLAIYSTSGDSGGQPVLVQGQSPALLDSRKLREIYRSKDYFKGD